MSRGEAVARGALRWGGRALVVAGVALDTANVVQTWSNHGTSAGLREAGVTAVAWAGAWAGAKVGAAVGAAFGSAVPLVGTAVGAVVGSITGGVIGYFAGRHSASAADEALFGER
jgi:phage tail tape-measure protein